MSISMHDPGSITALDQAEEEILTAKLSDEALEAAAGAGEKREHTYWTAHHRFDGCCW